MHICMCLGNIIVLSFIDIVIDIFIDIFKIICCFRKPNSLVRVFMVTINDF